MMTSRKPDRSVRRRLLAGALGLGLALLTTILAVTPAQAATDNWADFTFGGTSRNYSGTMQQKPSGFPSADYVSSSVAGTAVGLQTGVSTYLSAATEVGATYGSSYKRPYLSLRPNGLNAAPPSVTTYTFDRPTPSSGWTFVLGDIDSDQVTITATGVGGVALTPAALGFRSVFNYCTPGVCTANPDVPTWDPTTGVLTGNQGAQDTNGAAAWFEPNVPLTSLTFTFARRSGSPVYQTFFAALSHDLTGTVSAPAGRAGGLTVELYDPQGNLVDTTETDADGGYAFPNLATYAGYRVALVRPNGLTSDEALIKTADLSSSNQVVDFSLRAIVPVAASGTVLDPDDNPVAGVTVTLTGPVGPPVTRVSGADGTFLFDTVPIGDGWTVTATAPEGTTVSAPKTFNVPGDSEDPVENLNFTVTPRPTGSIAGTVDRDDGGVQPGVTLEVKGPEGRVYRTTTGTDGTYSIGDLPPGDYTVTVVPPDGFSVEGGQAELAFTIPEQGGRLTRDFTLVAPTVPSTFTASGQVSVDGKGVPGVEVVITDPTSGDETSATTGENGTWRAEDLPSGAGYTARVVPPKGYSAATPELSFDVDDANVSGLNFSLTADASPSPSPSPSPSTASPTPPSSTTSAGPSASASTSTVPPGTGSGGPGGLADTGGPSLLIGGVGALLLLGGGALLVHSRLRRGRH